MIGVLYFFNQIPRLLFFLCLFSAATIRGRSLFKGGVYFFGKPTDIKDGWIRCVRVIQRWLLDTVSSSRSLSVLLSAGNELYYTNSPSASLVTVVRNICTRVYTSCGYYSRTAFILLKAFVCGSTVGGCMGAVSIRRSMVTTTDDQMSVYGLSAR